MGISLQTIQNYMTELSYLSHLFYLNYLPRASESGSHNYPLRLNRHTCLVTLHYLQSQSPRRYLDQWGELHKRLLITTFSQRDGYNSVDGARSNIDWRQPRPQHGGIHML